MKRKKEILDIPEFKEDPDAVAVGMRLAYTRRIFGLSQEDVDEKLGFCYHYMSQVETGKRCSDSFLYRYAKATGVSLDYLYGLKDQMRSMDSDGKKVAGEQSDAMQGADRLDSIRAALAPEDRGRFEDYLYNVAKDATQMSDGKLRMKPWIGV